MSILTVVDHASNFVPSDIDLGISPALLETHIAWDIGAAALTDALGYPAHLAPVSRLVIDLNREEDAPGLIPLISDGIAIPGNPGDRGDRVARFYRPYHDTLAARIAGERPRLLLSLHSFTPQLADQPDKSRLWEIGVLYNNDDRAARIALPLLEAAGLIAGDQQPYSGKLLNATMNRHGEGSGTHYLGVERPIIDTCLDQIAPSGKATRL
jgi:predicted N-formylglutamate amidohydrolase